MRLRIYRAATMTAAMAAVRTELGAEAIILGSRRTASGIEVTAALEHGDEVPPPAIDARRAAALAWHGVPAPLLRRLERGPLETALEGALRFARPALEDDAKPLLLAGPPGAGKTLTTVRLAARLVMAGIRPMVVTADGRRAGAAEQLAAFTRLLGLNLLVASNPVSLGRALARRERPAPVLIDTPGFDPFDPGDRDELAALAATAGASIALVLPAGTDAAEAADLACCHADGGATLLVATRLDLARRLGGVLAAAGSGLALAEAGVGPGAADGLVPLTPALLAARLMQTPRAAPPGADRPLAHDARLKDGT
jgi:flagellar biosynthesis protein FlhF